MEITYTVVTHEEQMSLMERLRAACGGRADGAEFPYFLKRHNPSPEWYARYHPEGTRFYRDTRGLPQHEAGPAFWVGDEEWIVTNGPDGAECVYRYPRGVPGEGSGSDGWDLD
jgi:hypothetical protein